MTTFGDQVFQHGGVPVASNRLLPADARLVAPAGDYKPYKHWYPRWKRSRFHTTIPVAYNACAGSKNEVIHLALGDHTLDETLTWSKDNTHLLGTSITRYQPMLDIWQGAAFTPMIEVSGDGNVFSDMTIRHGTEAADVIGMLISGDDNVFENVFVATPQVAGQDVAEYRGVRISGHNNYFYRCMFGSDRGSAQRDQANYNMVIDGVSNVFEDCVFFAVINGTAPFFLGLSIDYVRDTRVTIFKNCTFIAYSSDWTVTMAKAIECGVSTAGGFYFDPFCQFVNVTKIADVSDSGHLWMASAAVAPSNATGISKRNLGA